MSLFECRCGEMMIRAKEGENKGRLECPVCKSTAVYTMDGLTSRQERLKEQSELRHEDEDGDEEGK